MRCPGSKLANLVRLTADEAERMVRTWLLEPNQVRFLNLVREFRKSQAKRSEKEGLRGREKS